MVILLITIASNSIPDMALAVSLQGPSSARHQPSAVPKGDGEPGELEPVAQFGFAYPMGMITSGDLAFVALQRSQVTEVDILDLENPAQPAVLAEISIESTLANPLAVVGEILYVGLPNAAGPALLWGGFKIFDIRDASNPVFIGVFSPSYEMRPIKMVVSVNTAYMLDNAGGINVLDISDPANPTLLGHFPEASYRNLAVQGAYAYACVGNSNTLDIYDISNPALSELVGSYILPEGRGCVELANAFAVKGSYAYVLEWDSHEASTEVIDISDPAQPVHHSDLAQLALFWYEQLVFSDDLLYAVAYGNPSGLMIYDASDPLDPQYLGRYPSYDGIAVHPQADLAAFLDMDGLHMLDTSDPGDPSRLGIYAWPQHRYFLGGEGLAAEEARLFTVRNDTWINGGHALLQVIDITVPGEPQVSGFLSIDSWLGGDIVISGTWLYLGTDRGLLIVDTADPANMQAVLLPTGCPAGSVEVLAETAYVTSSCSRDPYAHIWLSIIDVSEPLAPILLGGFDLGINAHDLSVARQGAGTVAYIITEAGGWQAVDVSDPAAPVVLFQDQSSLGIQRIETVSQGGQTIIYLAKSAPPDEGLIAMDVCDPVNPQILGVFPLNIEVAHILMAEETLAYYAEWNGNDLKLIDFSQPAQPRWVGSASLPGVSIEDAALTHDYLIALSDDDAYFFANRIHLEGRVTDHNIVPIEGVTLALSNGAASVTGPDGLYAFPDLVFSSYTVTPTLGEYVFAPPFAVLEGFVQGWQNFVMLVPPVSATLEPGITTTLTYTDTQGLPTSFVFPAGLVSTTTTATVTPTLASPFFGMDFAGHAFDLSLQEAGSATEILTFTLPVSVTIQYSPMDTATIYDAGLLALYRQEGDAWVKIETACLENPVPVPVEPWVFRASLCQSGRYALFGPTHGIALPYVSFGSHAGGSPPPPPVNEVSLSRQ